MTKAANLAALSSGPAFSASPSGTQSFSGGVFVKVALGSEQYDTNSNFDSTTNYRFQPTVAGYYQFNLIINLESSTTVTRALASIAKNGSIDFLRVSDMGGTLNSVTTGGSCLVYLNGSTDYVEMYVYATGSGLVISNAQTYFQGALARAA